MYSLSRILNNLSYRYISTSQLKLLTENLGEALSSSQIRSAYEALDKDGKGKTRSTDIVSTSQSFRFVSYRSPLSNFVIKVSSTRMNLLIGGYTETLPSLTRNPRHLRRAAQATTTTIRKKKDKR
jgi:hypothetical protein